ncbi:hypothetical protein GCM10009716_15440 [Streptomyces sodiiphilus]|uniref:Beta-N-acetylhexosaminidase n=1 Tax=Streptomyces sodiiphilus TaxID=226217 RepID=A0ABN2NXD7_9ACTN
MNRTAVILAVIALLTGAAVLTALARLPAEQPWEANRPDRPAEAEPGPDADPVAIPAPRSWQPEHGPGWGLGGTTRVVADPGGPLAAEADRLAGELGVDRSAEPARPGDIELALRSDPRHGEEGYTLVSRSGFVTVTAGTEAGVFYGTRTLLQNVRENGGLAEGVIRDAPDRPQRGLLLDVARKHLPAEWIEDRLHEMAGLKLNQLQLHLTDDQGFRIESETHPEVVSDPHLTKDEIRSIIDLAESLHITVIPEIDSPGHLGAVLKAHPGLQLRDTGGRAAPGAIDISDPRAAELVDGLLREYAGLFPGPLWHLGGDEYRALDAADPEASYPKLAARAEEKYGPGAGVRDLATGWLNDRADVVRELGRTPEVWNDGMHRGGVVAPDAERHVAYWTGREIGARPPEEYLAEGRPLVNFNSAYLYYVLGEPVGFVYPTGEAIYREWAPLVLRGSEPVPEEYAGSVLGARFAVWCDLSEAQTAEEVAEGIRLPLRAFAQKVWNPADPEAEWEEFTGLADRLGE